MLSDDTDMPYGDEDEELEDWPTSEPATPSQRHTSDLDEDEDYLAPDEPAPGFTIPTSFDAYFLHASKASRTSSNVFSALVPPLTPEEYAGVLSKLQVDPREQERILWRDARTRTGCFRRFRTELEEGFNLMMYGYGSKREFLNAFAKDLARTGAHIVVANGFQPSFAFKDLLGTIEQIPGVLDSPSTSASSSSVPSAGAGVEPQTQKIHTFFSSRDSPHLYIIIHNIEGAAFRAPKNRAALALLALAPHIHLVASVDHIAASQRWSLSELFARKPDPSSSPSSSSAPPAASSSVQAAQGVVPRRGFAWLWHDLTTLAPYDFELAFADPTSLSGAAALRGARTPAASAAAAAAAGGAAAPQGALVTETAARHVLASVTQKAKKLFVMLGSKQLEVMDAPSSESRAAAKAKEGAGAGDAQKGGATGEGDWEGAYDYDRLFAAARDNFVATNDAALRALLGEFRDHGLVVGAEALWIPMRRDALVKIVGELKAEGH